MSEDIIKEPSISSVDLEPIKDESNVPDIHEIPNDVLMGEFLERVKEDPKLGKIVSKTLIQMKMERFSGPIPHPDILEKYNKIEPDSANRIITMAEKQQNHRHGIEERALNCAYDIDRRGQNYALTVSLTIIVGSILLISIGKEVAGTILAGGTLTGLAYIFISGRKREDSEEDKIPEIKKEIESNKDN